MTGEKPAGYVSRDSRPVVDLGRKALRVKPENSSAWLLPDLDDQYAGYIRGEDGVYRRPETARVESPHTPAFLHEDFTVKPLTEASTVDEGLKIIENTRYVGTSPEDSGDLDILRKLPF